MREREAREAAKYSQPRFTGGEISAEREKMAVLNYWKDEWRQLDAARRDETYRIHFKQRNHDKIAEPKMVKEVIVAVRIKRLFD